MIDLPKDFVYDDLDDPVDLVLSTDMDIDAAIESVEERLDSSDSAEIIKAMKENGDLDYDVDEEDEAMMYSEDEDDAVDIVDVDAEDYREALDVDEIEDMEEDDDIDTVIDADPNAPIEDLEDSDIR